MGENFGKLFSGLAKTSVTQPGRDPQYYSNPAAAGIAAAQSAERAQPGTVDVQGHIGDPTTIPTPYTNAGDPAPGADIVTTRMINPPPPAQPSLATPSFAAAQDKPEALTTKGKVLSILLSSMAGAGAGAQAASQGSPKTGYPSGLVGLSAGIATPFELSRMRRQAAQDDLAQKSQEAAVASIPEQVAARRAQQAADLRNTQSMISERDARTQALVDAPGADPFASIDLQISHAVGAARAAGRDPSTDPTVLQLQDVKAQGLKQPDNDPEFRAWQDQHKGEPIENYFKARYPKQQINIGGSGDPNGDIAIVAHGLVDGTLGVQALGRMAPNAKLAAIAAAKRIDPSFDMTNFPARQKVALDFAGGKGSDQVQSFNTFLAHAADLSAAVNDFRNTRSPFINKSVNWLRKNSGDPAVASYLAKTEPVRTEFASFLQNNHALTESDKQEANKVLDDNYAPAQMQVVLKSMAHTAALRLREVNKRYSNTMRVDYPGLLDPQNEEFLNATGAMSVLGKGGASSGSSGIQVTAPDGSVHTFANQASANTFKKLAGIQ